jgi:hypothetical protein
MSANTVPEEHRPKTVVIVAAFLFGATILAFITGESLLFPDALLDYMWRFNPEGAALFHSIGRVSGVFLLVLGAGTFFAAFGLLRGRLWAWWFAIFLFAIDASGNIVSYFLSMMRYAPYPVRSSRAHFCSFCVANPFALTFFARR